MPLARGRSFRFGGWFTGTASERLLREPLRTYVRPNFPGAPAPAAAGPEVPPGPYPWGVTVSTDLAVATRDLRKSYGSRVALGGLDLSVPTGVVYGFLGPNGAGKTTTMRLLTGLLHPDSGSIHLLGSPFARGDRRRLFRVGALIESPSFYPYLNGRQNLRALAATGAPVPANRVEELLELVGLRDRGKDKVSGYSLGMRQRLGIAAALLSDPQLLLLDEPANGLDPAGIVAMRETLRHLAATGKTVFVSSHLLAEIQIMADVVGIIASGRLVREGTMQELLGSQQVVRVRVTRDASAAAIDLLGSIGTATVGATGAPEADPGAVWLSVPAAPNRAAEINRLLASGGIYASALESGSDLEMLFLELTGGEPVAGSEGTFQGIGTAR
jgi:ABC-2 type transport system ATP-binding protein